MQMNLDFCFIDDAGVVAVAGWTTEVQPQLRLHVDDETLAPVAITRHARRDLRSSEPLGLVALFDLSGLRGDTDPARATIHLAEGSDYIEIQPDRLAEDATRLVEIGVDEVFFALLRLIAQRRVVLADRRMAGEIYGRLRLAPSAGRETENRILGIDSCQMAPSGQGAVIGWYLSARVSPEPICALAIADGSVVPVDILSGSMARSDLSAYAPRFRFSGSDGFCGGWRFPGKVDGAARLLLMLPDESFGPGVMVAVDTVPAADLARHVTQAALGIEDMADRGRLRRAMLPAALPTPRMDMEDSGTAEPGEAEQGETELGRGDTLLILDHDLPDCDLRDVLRRIGPHLTGPLSLHLLRPRLTPVLQNAVEGAAREMAAGLHLRGASLAIARPGDSPARVVFARSSTLFQFDPEPIFTSTRPIVTLLDPIGTILAAPQATADRFARDLLPFVLSVPGALFHALLDQVPAIFLTEEARVRLLAETLILEGQAVLTRVDCHSFFEGKSGPHAQSFLDGSDWHAFDARSRQLIEEAGA